jgi:hypothetical protein
VKEGIAFFTFKAFLNHFSDLKAGEKSSIVCIFDEIDSALFFEDDGLIIGHQILPNLNKMIGFTGSDLKDFHVRAAIKAIEGNFIKMVVQDSFKPPQVCHGVEVLNRVSDYSDIIEALCSQQVTKTPIIVIADDSN